MGHHLRVQFHGVHVRTGLQQMLRQRPLPRPDLDDRLRVIGAHRRRDLFQDRLAG
jgi:hypothetical protein